MTAKELIEAMAAKAYWTSPHGLTPQATLFAALSREVSTKGEDARFVKTEPGKFALVVVVTRSLTKSASGAFFEAVQQAAKAMHGGAQ